MRVFQAERKRIPKTDDSLADDAGCCEPISDNLSTGALAAVDRMAADKFRLLQTLVYYHLFLRVFL
jgi:hypothetical protein